MTRTITDLHELVRAPIDLDEVARFFDELHHEARVEAARSLTGKEQAALFEAAAGYRKLTVDDFVAPTLDPLVPVRMWGKNSLPAFTDFQKPMCRPDDAAARAAGELWGYNEQAMKAVTGPGYFVAYDLPDTGEVLIDYTRLPPHGVPGWPRLIPNSARLSRVIYHGTQDTMRGVSTHVTIGRAARAGEWMPNWFVLVREDRA